MTARKGPMEEMGHPKGMAADRDMETACFGYRRVPAAEKARLVRQHFDSIAKKYDRMNSILSLGLHHSWKRFAVKALDLRAGERVLDLCGGTGDLSRLAARKVGPRGEVILCDINRAMIDAGRPKAGRAPQDGRIQYVQGDAERLPFPGNRFDAAMVGFGVRNLTRPEEGFKEMHRVLRPGGKLMCLEFSRPTAALFRWLYHFYSFQIMPLAGQLLAGSRKAYTYLPESIRLFPLPGELQTLLEALCFSKVKYHRLTNGIAVVHLGVKRRT